MLSKLVYLPIEFYAREFASKVLLASELLSRGYVVVIGQQWDMLDNLGSLPVGVVMFKSHNAIFYPYMSQAKSYGYHVCALEEETMAASTKRALGKCSTQELYKHVDTLFVHGRFEKTFHLERGVTDKAVLEVGNPRVDLLRAPFIKFFDDLVDEIRTLHPSYLLINSNFGFKNSVWDYNPEQLRALCTKSGFLVPGDPDSEKDYEDMILWESKCYELVLSFVELLEKHLPNLSVIVRPHPGESERKVVDQYAEFDNVIVRREGNHLPWTLGSSSLLHCSCTTGLEAYIAGRPALSLIPYSNWYSDSILSNKFNGVTNDPSRAFELLAPYLDFNKDKIPAGPNISEKLETYIANVKDEFSFSLIANYFDSLKYLPTTMNFSEISNGPRRAVAKEKCSFTEDDLRETLLRFLSLRGAEGLPNPTRDFSTYKIADSLYCLAP